MVGVQRVMAVSTPAESVLGYLADFGHSEVWDPRTKACTRSDDGGPIEIGSTWHNVSVFSGRKVELTYTLVDRSDSRLVFVGENSTVTATDDIVVESTDDGGSIVTLRAEVRFKGLLKLAAPLLRPEFERFGDEVERVLPPLLERLTG